MGICLTRTSVRSSWTRSSDKTVNITNRACRVVAKYLQWYKRRHTSSPRRARRGDDFSAGASPGDEGVSLLRVLRRWRSPQRGIISKGKAKAKPAEAIPEEEESQPPADGGQVDKYENILVNLMLENAKVEGANCERNKAPWGGGLTAEASRPARFPWCGKLSRGPTVPLKRSRSLALNTNVLSPYKTCLPGEFIKVSPSLTDLCARTLRMGKGGVVVETANAEDLDRLKQAQISLTGVSPGLTDSQLLDEILAATNLQGIDRKRGVRLCHQSRLPKQGERRTAREGYSGDLSKAGRILEHPKSCLSGCDRCGVESPGQQVLQMLCIDTCIGIVRTRPCAGDAASLGTPGKGSAFTVKLSEVRIACICELSDSHVSERIGIALFAGAVHSRWCCMSPLRVCASELRLAPVCHRWSMGSAMGVSHLTTEHGDACTSKPVTRRSIIAPVLQVRRWTASLIWNYNRGLSATVGAEPLILGTGTEVRRKKRYRRSVRELLN
ncbi:hypothetical protein FQR65_LT16863 [Abscondita terminalis]|nr:hypothetical protein FQR65_LT16863 [Abscondita terminalis]